MPIRPLLRFVALSFLVAQGAQARKRPTTTL